jgi:putative zinc finger/helix-turn-helix YgiT family protein
MKRCVECGSENLSAGDQPITLDVGDRSFDGLVRGWRCSQCEELYYDGQDLEDFEHQAAAWLAKHGVRTHHELKFMRKAVGIRAADLAKWLDVTPETVSHWETGKHTPDIAVRLAIGRLVLDAIERTTTTVDQLRLHGNPDNARKVRIERAA